MAIPSPMPVLPSCSLSRKTRSIASGSIEPSFSAMTAISSARTSRLLVALSSSIMNPLLSISIIFIFPIFQTLVTDLQQRKRPVFPAVDDVHILRRGIAIDHKSIFCGLHFHHRIVDGHRFKDDLSGFDHLCLRQLFSLFALRLADGFPAPGVIVLETADLLLAFFQLPLDLFYGVVDGQSHLFFFFLAVDVQTVGHEGDLRRAPELLV